MSVLAFPPIRCAGVVALAGMFVVATPAGAQAHDVTAIEPLSMTGVAGAGLRLGSTGSGARSPDGRGQFGLVRPQRSVALSGTLGRRSRTLWQATWRESDPALDDGSFATAALQARHRNLAARFTYRDGDARDLHALAEWSTARPSSTTLPNATFRFALGLDKRVASGAWVELRVGQRRVALYDREEGAVAVTLRLAPGSP